MKLRIAIIFVVVFTLMTTALPVNAAARNQEQFATGRILVKFKDGVDKATEDAIHGKNGGKVLSENTDLGVQIVQVDAGKVNEKVNTYLSNSDVQFAEPDYTATLTDIPTDPLLSQQWALPDIAAPQAWNITAGNAVVKIAVLDTGIDQDHEDLMGKIVANVNFSSSPTVDDLFGHGTHVAGIIAAADNGIGVVGISYNCSLMNVKVMDDNGSGYYSAIANGITWAADNGAKVISMSLGGTSPSTALADAVNYAWQKGVVLVAAAGNNNSSTPFHPAYYKNCISVAATGQDDTKAYFSSYVKWVDVAAPGIAILSTLPDDPCQVSSQLNYGLLSGTSMATPFVAGLAGLLWSTPNGVSNSNIVSCIENSADQITGTKTFWQYGKINVLNAVTQSSQNNIRVHSLKQR